MLYDGVYGPIRPNTLKELVCYKVFELRQEMAIDKELVQVYATNQQPEKFSERWKSFMAAKMPYVESFQNKVKNDEALKAKELLERIGGRPIALKVPEFIDSAKVPFAKPLFKSNRRPDPLKKNIPGEKQ